MDGGNWKEMFNAACAGDLELVRYHVAQGVDVNYAHPEFLSTPLVASILAGRPEVAMLLLDAGADPRLGSEFDAMTPVQAARQAGLQAVEARLVAMGAAPVPRPSEAAVPPRAGWLARLCGRTP